MSVTLAITPTKSEDDAIPAVEDFGLKYMITLEGVR